jgi:hypothetical protein
MFNSEKLPQTICPIAIDYFQLLHDFRRHRLRKPTGGTKERLCKGRLRIRRTAAAGGVERAGKEKRRKINSVAEC